MTSLVVRKVRSGGVTKLKLVPVVRRTISEGVLKLERVQVICPACGQQGKAVATDGRVKGYCAVAKQYVDFLIETQLEEIRIKHSAAAKELWQDPDYRAKQSATMKKLWQDPEYRAKQIAAHTSKRHTAEHRAKISAALKRRHNKRG